ncbi:hypothetical protein DPMN_136154 [Dreissena polymorpha]|uniref:Uncharacterized protein n=1 Tax=Dreissena polymorpha TaxID=45954 RepID=A0A9D4G2U8_DREPO|nr:hypothetical protein DPMN_136154 [Dreissena polymorpha]
MNLLTKFYEDQTVNVASRVLTPYNHVFQANIIIFELIHDIIGTNLLTKFHEHWTTRNRSIINVASRNKCPTPGGHVFKATKTIFELIQDIIGTNLLTKFHEDRKINVASRPYLEKCPAPGGHVFQPTSIIFKLIQNSNGMNLLTKFHKNWTINMASRVKNTPPLCSHVFSSKGYHF